MRHTHRSTGSLLLGFALVVTVTGCDPENPGDDCETADAADGTSCPRYCSAHDDCNPGERCSPIRIDLGGGARSLCEPGCRDDRDCDGGYCDLEGFFGPYICFEEPAAVECGDTQCQPLRGLFGPLPACCRDADSGTCGVEASGLGMAEGCYEVTEGAIDETCPQDTGLAPCRAQDDRCGTVVSRTSRSCAITDAWSSLGDI